MPKGNGYGRLIVRPPTAVGMLIACAVLLLSFGLAGAGHGWTTPLLFSIAGLALNPLAFLVHANPAQFFRMRIGLIAIAIALNVLLYLLTVQEGVTYFHRMGAASHLWLAFWAIWQVVVVLSFAGKHDDRQTGH